MSHVYDDAVAHSVVDVTRELYESASTSSSSSLRAAREALSHPLRRKPRAAVNRRDSVSSSFSSAHECELLQEASHDTRVTDSVDGRSDPDNVAVRSPAPLEFMTTHLEEEGRAELLLTEEEQRRCLFRAFTAYRTLIRIREADACEIARPLPVGAARRQIGTTDAAADTSEAAVQHYLGRLMAQTRARRTQSAAHVEAPDGTDVRTASQPASTIPSSALTPPARWPSFTRAAGVRERALRDALLTTIQTSYGNGTGKNLGGHAGDEVAMTMRGSDSRFPASSAPWPQRGQRAYRNTTADLQLYTPHTTDRHSDDRLAALRLSRVHSPKAWRQRTPTRAESAWNLSTNPHSLSAASRGLDVLHATDDSTEVSLAPSSHALLYRDNTASRQRCASSAARLAGDTAKRGRPRRPAQQVAASAPTAGGVSACGRQTLHRTPPPPRGRQHASREAVTSSETAARGAVEKAYWTALNALLHTFVVEGTRLLRRPMSDTVGVPMAAADGSAPAVTQAEAAPSYSSCEAGRPAPSPASKGHYCACLGATLSSHLTVLSVDAACRHDVRVGDRVAAVEGTSVHRLADIMAAEQVLSWDATADQYWTLVRDGLRRVVVHLAA